MTWVWHACDTYAWCHLHTARFLLVVIERLETKFDMEFCYKWVEHVQEISKEVRCFMAKRKYSTQLWYVPIVLKQWFVHIESVQYMYVYWYHNDRADPGISVWWHDWIYPTIVMSIHIMHSLSRSYHYFQTKGTYRNSSDLHTARQYQLISVQAIYKGYFQLFRLIILFGRKSRTVLTLYKFRGISQSMICVSPWSSTW